MTEYLWGADGTPYLRDDSGNLIEVPIDELGEPSYLEGGDEEGFDLGDADTDSGLSIEEEADLDDRIGDLESRFAALHPDYEPVGEQDDDGPISNEDMAEIFEVAEEAMETGPSHPHYNDIVELLGDGDPAEVEEMLEIEDEGDAVADRLAEQIEQFEAETGRQATEADIDRVVAAEEAASDPDFDTPSQQVLDDIAEQDQAALDGTSAERREAMALRLQQRAEAQREEEQPTTGEPVTVFEEDGSARDSQVYSLNDRDQRREFAYRRLKGQPAEAADEVVDIPDEPDDGEEE